MRREGFVGVHTLSAHTQNLCPQTCQLFIIISESAGFFGAARCEVGGVEIENQRSFGEQRLQRVALAVLVDEVEFRRLGSFFQHGQSPALAS